MAKVALIGNPNVGKSVVFNALTGLNQTIANFPGCTVEKKKGGMYYQEQEIEVIDLPGIYSLSPHSIDEEISRDYLLNEQPDLVVAVLDASNLERNLYLTIQLMELKVPLILVLNMMDLAKGKGLSIDVERLERNLGIPIIPAIASKGKGIDTIKSAICTYIDKPPKYPNIIWPKEAEIAINQVLKLIRPYITKIEKNYPHKWLATSLIENDQEVWKIIKNTGANESQLRTEIQKITREYLGEDGNIALVDDRYKIVSELINEVVTKTSDKRWVFSDMLDEVLTNKYLGIPIFLVIMWGVFQLTFTVGDPLVQLIELGFDNLGQLVYLITDLLDQAGNGHNPISDFIVGAFVDGVGSVIVFLPYIVILFIAMAILEDTGYLSRVAYLMDKIMSRIGLQGQSIIPMILGFGCNVPAIMATRAIKNEQDRMTTIMVNSFIPCSARFPVFVIIAGAIFQNLAGVVSLGLYLLGIIVAITFAWTFRKTLFKGDKAELIIELQPYTVPTPQSVFMKMWHQIKMFLKKASTIIFASVVIIYLLDEAGIMLYLGKAVSYAFWWMKTGTGSSIGWEYGAAIIAGLIAKEVVIGTLGTLLGGDQSTGNGSFQETLALLGPAAGIGYLVFILLYTPCVATLATIKQETRSWKWTIFSLIFTSIVAYALAAAAYFIAVGIISLL